MGTTKHTPKLCKPNRFDGKITGPKAEVWEEGMLAYVLANRYSDKDALATAVSFLSGDAKLWWRAALQMLGDAAPQVGYISF